MGVGASGFVGELCFLLSLISLLPEWLLCTL